MGARLQSHLAAMKSNDSQAFYAQFVDRLRSEYAVDKVKDGVFGAMMSVSLVNDGPITLILDSRRGDHEAS